MSYPAASAQFTPGFRLLDGSDLQKMVDGSTSFASAITAFAGGGQTSATQLNNCVNEVVTVASAADSVKLPRSYPGAEVVVINAHAANAIQVFGTSPDTINGVATGTGVSQAATKSAVYRCPVAGKWYRILSA